MTEYEKINLGMHDVILIMDVPESDVVVIHPHFAHVVSNATQMTDDENIRMVKEYEDIVRMLGTIPDEN